LTIIIREVGQKDNQKTDRGIVFRQILINAKLQIGKRGHYNRAAWKSIKEVKVHIGL
jgi:hypothetical protein